MSYEFKISEPIDVGVRRIASELIDNSIARVEAADRNNHKAVYEVRKNCKRVRGLLRLIRPQVPGLYQTENTRFRDAAASLSGIRDTEAALESYDALLLTFEDEVDRRTLAPVRRALKRHKQHLSSEGVVDLDARLDEFGERMREARGQVPIWKIPTDTPKRAHGGFKLFGSGLTMTYARGRKALRDADDDPSIERLHEWRKCTKYLRYHLRLLRPAWPALLEPIRCEVKILGDLLGDDHDLAVLEQVLEQALSGNNAHQDQLKTLEGLIRRRSRDLRSQAHWLGRRVYAEKPEAFRKRIRSYWATARDQQRST